MNKPKLKAKAAETAKVTSKSIMDSAQQIWLAGVGAFGKAQEKGSELFDALVKEGVSLESKTRKLATGTMNEVRGVVETKVEQVKERAADTWDRLEKVFEDRVSRALGRLGVPGRDEIQSLIDRVDSLSKDVKKTATSGMRRTTGKVKDELASVAKDLEEAQLAAKKTVKRTASKAKKAVKKIVRRGR